MVIGEAPGAEEDRLGEPFVGQAGRLLDAMLAAVGLGRDRGVFIATASFTSGAKAEAERINARIELIDGTRLAELLVKYEVGVQAQQTVVLHRVDEDFFEQVR